MTNRPRQGLIGIHHLTAGVRSEIEALVATCKRHEPGLDLPLYLPARSAPGETSLLCPYDDDVLVGAANLMPGDDVEVVGAVHPAHQRVGIGHALLNAVVHECRHRGASNLILVCEEATPSGKAFAHAVGGVYRFSEHRMELDCVAFAQRQPSRRTLVIERASVERELGACGLDG